MALKIKLQSESSMKSDTHKRARLRLDERLQALQPSDRFRAPPQGWVRALRDALGMTRSSARALAFGPKLSKRLRSQKQQGRSSSIRCAAPPRLSIARLSMPSFQTARFKLSLRLGHARSRYASCSALRTRCGWNSRDGECRLRSSRPSLHSRQAL